MSRLTRSWRGVALTGAVALWAGCSAGGHTSSDANGFADALVSDVGTGPTTAGRTVAAAEVGADGATLVVEDATSPFTGAEVRFAPGALDGTRRVKLVELVEHPRVGTLPVPILAVTADGALPRGGWTVTLPTLDAAYGIPEAEQAVFALGLGAPQWADITSGAPKAAGGRRLVGDVAKLPDLADIEIVGLDPGRATAAVRAGAHGVSSGDLFNEPCLGCTLSFLLADHRSRIPYLVQPYQLVAPDGMTLREYLCDAAEPALLLHGVLSHFDGFRGPDDLLASLGSRGFAVGKFAYPSAESVWDNGAALADWLRAARGGCDAPPGALRPVAAVGHSMGGLVLRAAVQAYRAGDLLGNVVMLATPNAGGDTWKAEAAGIADWLGLPGPAALEPGNPTLDPSDPGSLNAVATVAAHADRYFVVTGWAEQTGPEATDGYVEVASALSLALPYGHEHYLSGDGGGRIVARTPPAEGDRWDGVADGRLDHSAIHTLAEPNGVSELVAQQLRAGGGACTADCDGRRCGDDGCGGHCGRCRQGLTCNDVGQCVAGDAGVGSAADGGVPECVAQCGGRRCGDDGCGGSCGVCAGGLVCGANGQCAAAPPVPQGFVRIEAGVFTMGSPANEAGRFDDETQHQVTLTRAFALKATEVTQGEWFAVMGTRPSRFAGCGDDCPVERVSWYAAVAYCNALSLSEGLPRCYADGGGADYDAADANSYTRPTWRNGLDCQGYRLPTEAEWEYAARAGTVEASYNGPVGNVDCGFDASLDPIAWYCGNSGGETTHPVGRKRANPWGLYDMLGNVWEWSWDWYAGYPAGAAQDPQGPAAGDDRVFRGGYWFSFAQDVRAANRYNGTPDVRRDFLGFRPARSL